MTERRIVVGVDGSSTSVQALRWAANEAKLRGATVDVVHAWNSPYVGELAAMAARHVDRENIEQEARSVLSTSVEEAGLPSDVVMERILVEGNPAAALVLRAAGADLLVLGSRGRGGFAGLLLGSVSQQCAHHAACPVVIVR
jgi:nucleotide-binding universal stress UspA family protein